MAKIIKGDYIQDKILKLLEKKEELRTVELAHFLGKSETIISKHLTKLKKQKYLDSKKEGRRIYWKTKETPKP